jgi:hypothetical protein
MEAASRNANEGQLKESSTKTKELENVISQQKSFISAKDDKIQELQ